jgi:hypothetical protein
MVLLLTAGALLALLLKQFISNPLDVLACAGIYLHRLTFVNKERNLDDKYDGKAKSRTTGK